MDVTRAYLLPKQTEDKVLVIQPFYQADSKLLAVRDIRRSHNRCNQFCDSRHITDIRIMSVEFRVF
jgi:hypothetical protein